MDHPGASRRRSASLLTSVFLTLASGAAGAIPPPSCDALVERASESMKSILYDEARELFLEAAGEEACKVEAWLGLAEVGNRTAKWGDARAAAEKVLGATSNRVLLAEAQFQIGNSSYRRGSRWSRQRRAAERAFVLAIELSEGTHTRAISRLKKLYSEVGETTRLAELEQRFPDVGFLGQGQVAALGAEAPVAESTKKASGSGAPPSTQPAQWPGGPFPVPAGWPDLNAPRPADHGCLYAGEGQAPAVIRSPERIYDLPPHYTEQARKKRIQGTVVTWVVVDEHGVISQAVIVKSLAPDLDQSTLDAMRRWRFKPAQTDEGQAVACYYQLTTTFRLQ